MAAINFAVGESGCRDYPDAIIAIDLKIIDHGTRSDEMRFKNYFDHYFNYLKSLNVFNS